LIKPDFDVWKTRKGSFQERKKIGEEEPIVDQFFAKKE
jgi:hypothetical protein